MPITAKLGDPGNELALLKHTPSLRKNQFANTKPNKETVCDNARFNSPTRRPGDSGKGLSASTCTVANGTLGFTHDVIVC